MAATFLAVSTETRAVNAENEAAQALTMTAICGAVMLFARPCTAKMED
jgi:hypothetical protein